VGFDRTSLVVAAALLAVSVPLVLLVTLRLQRRPAVRFSTVVRARHAGRSLRWRLRHVPLAVRLLAVTLLLVGFARPRTPNRTTRVFTEGVAIQMVVDRSSSMREPMSYEGKQRSRFEVVRSVLRDFVLGDGKTLKGRPNDLIGLTSFSAFVQDNCPLTLDHDNLVAYMNSMQAVRMPRGPFVDPDDGTAIGDAIYHAVLRLVNAEQELEEAEQELGEASKVRPGYTIKSKIIIMLTDGQQTYGELLPQDAAKFARQNGIAVYTIAVVDRGDVRRVDDDLFGSFLSAGRAVDTSDIRQVAAITGGTFGEATDGESLKAICAKIDKLERSRFQERIQDYDEHFDAWWAVPLAFGLLFVEVVGRNTLLRRVP
jgi:Ca-activated chloride channel family protein